MGLRQRTSSKEPACHENCDAILPEGILDGPAVVLALLLAGCMGRNA